jgi:glucose/mannose transport system permease protein
MADPSAAVAGSSSQTPWRILLWAILILFALFYLAPLYVMIATSLKSVEEIRAGNLLALPQDPSFAAWAKAWSAACVGVECTGIGRFFWNSVKMVVPAVLISTLIGALNGYVLTKWTFRGANIVFALILFGCFIPFQIVLIPMARTLGLLGIASTTPGLVLVHVVYGLCFTTLYFRNFYAAFPTDLVKAAKIDGAGFFTIFWRIMLPNSLPILVVTVIWQFTNIWNDFLFGASFAAGGAAPITVALNNIVNTSTGVKEYNVDMASAMMTALPTLLVYVLAGQYFVRGMMAGAVKG